MKKSTGIIVAILVFFSGAFFGLLLAPLKSTFGSNNGNTTINNNYAKDSDVADDDTADLEKLDGAEDEYKF